MVSSGMLRHVALVRTDVSVRRWGEKKIPGNDSQSRVYSAVTITQVHRYDRLQFRKYMLIISVAKTFFLLQGKCRNGTLKLCHYRLFSTLLFHSNHINCFYQFIRPLTSTADVAPLNKRRTNHLSAHITTAAPLAVAKKKELWSITAKMVRTVSPQGKIRAPPCNLL
jgi:hypothetical protein